MRVLKIALLLVLAGSLVSCFVHGPRRPRHQAPPPEDPHAPPPEDPHANPDPDADPDPHAHRAPEPEPPDRTPEPPDRVAPPPDRAPDPPVEPEMSVTVHPPRGKPGQEVRLKLNPPHSPVIVRLNGRVLPKRTDGQWLTVTIPADAQSGRFEVEWGNKKAHSPPFTVIR